ncbi:DNA repair protein XRCC3 [Tetrabaena socialis]|uniref:DNA repair protein XRCC3 n=1 Tax=Tetrabaena socialis TaxID=47790 RepID=A0A2J8AB49_9CHLO|nr:DNA repair protein XRCC3 [Tetrabaena socialis]|eukprot:PNH09750.1 DNA repair protein XRCC3 [Tetrabaena socialis]
MPETAVDGGRRAGNTLCIAGTTREAAAGKTQLVLQSLLTVQLPESEGGLAGNAVYIYTEGKPPVERLQSVLANRYSGRTDVSLAHVALEERRMHSPEDLLRSLHQLGALLARQAPEGDVRRERQAAPAVAARQGLPSTLRAQHPQSGAGPGGSRSAPLVSSGRRVLPALGLAWANCVNCRLFAARHRTWDGSVIRSLQVVFAPHLPHSYCCFRVTHDGVWGVGDDDNCPSGATAHENQPRSDVPRAPAYGGLSGG